MNINLVKASRIICDLISNPKLSVQDTDKIQTLIQQVNTLLFHNPTLKFQVTHDCTTPAGMEEFRRETEHILELWNEFEQLSAGNYANRQFAEIYAFLSMLTLR